MVCFSLIGFFTALFEPLLFKKRLSWIELCFALITVVGVMCIFSFDARHRTGIAIGVVSSAVCSLYAVCNKKVSAGVRSRTVLMYQMSGGLVAVSLITPFYLSFFPSQQGGLLGLACAPLALPEGPNLCFMLCHALFCTVCMYILQIQALKRLSTFTVNLSYNLEFPLVGTMLTVDSCRFSAQTCIRYRETGKTGVRFLRSVTVVTVLFLLVSS